MTVGLIDPIPSPGVCHTAQRARNDSDPSGVEASAAWAPHVAVVGVLCGSGEDGGPGGRLGGVDDRAVLQQAPGGRRAVDE